MRILAVIFAILGPYCLMAMDERLVDRYFSVLESNPASSQAADKLWELHATAGRQNDLIARTRNLAEGDPRALLAVAEFMERADRKPESKEALERAPLAGMGPAALMRAGTLWQKLGDPDAAVAAWNLAADQAPRDFSLRAKVAEACVMAGNTGAAASHWDVIAREAPAAERLTGLENLAGIQEAAADYGAAMVTASSALDLLSRSHWKTPLLTRRVIALAERAKLLDELEQQWSANESADRAFRLAALAAHRGDRPTQARWLREATETLPQDFALQQELASVQLALGDLPAAELAARAAWKLRPGDPAAVERLAEILALGGREQEATDLLGRAFPNDSAGRQQAILILRKLNLRTALESMLRAEYKANPTAMEPALMLAAFLAEVGGFDEAERTLLAAAQRDASPGNLARAAGFLLENGLTQAAQSLATRALEQDLTDASHPMLLADIHIATGDSTTAIKVLREASATLGLPPETFDRRLFDLMQREGEKEDASLKNLHTRTFMDELQTLAAKSQTEHDILRAARWAAWNAEHHTALETAQRGLDQHPKSVALHESIAAAHEALGEEAEAIAALARLAKLKPEEAARLNRRIARLELSRGNPAAAVATLSTEAARDPDDWQLTRELALAHQGAGNYYEALEHWIRTAEAAPPSELHGILRPTLACFTRLQLASRALDFLDRQAQRLPEGRQRIEWLRAASTFAADHGVLAEWQSRIEARATAEPGVPSWRLALSETGASPPPPSQPPIDTDSVEAELAAAEAAKDFETAARLAGKLAGRPEAGLAEWQRHAHFLTVAGKTDDATRVWEAIRARFARSQDALTEAAAYFEGIQDHAKAASCWRAASLLGPLPAHAWLALAEESLASGDRDRALDDYARVLQSVPPEPLPASGPFPLPQRLGAPTPTPAAGTDPRFCRSLALRGIGTLLRHSPDSEKQIADFSGEGAADRAWAFAAAGDAAMTLNALAPITLSNDAAASAFVLWCMEFQDFPRLLAWIAEAETPTTRWETFLAMSPQMLEAGWRPDPEKLGRLLLAAPPFVVAQFAETLAAAGLFRAAVAVGVPEGLPPEEFANALFRLAGWQLALRQPEQAEKALSTLVRLTPHADSFEESFFAALRALWLTTPIRNRASLEQEVVSQFADSPTSAAASKMLFAALRKDREAFRKHSAVWLTTAPQFRAPDGALRTALREGAQFEQWHLPVAARDVYRLALEQDAALSMLRGEPGVEAALEAAIVVSLLAEAEPAEASFITAEWQAKGAARDDLIRASARASGNGLPATARAISERAFLADPTDPQIWAQILSLAAFPDGLSELPGSWFLTATADNRARIPVQSLQLLANTLASRGRGKEALDILAARTTGGDPGGRLALTHATLLADDGQTKAAARLLNSAVFSPEIADAATHLRRKLGKSENPDAPSPLAALIAAPAEGATTALANFLATAPSPHARMAACETLLDSNPAAVRSLGDAEMGRLIGPAVAEVGLVARHFLARYRIAKECGTTGALIEELNSSNHPLAAEVLVRFAADSGDPETLDRSILEYLKNPQVGRTSMEGLAKNLLARDLPFAAARVLAHLDEDGIINHSLALAYAEALWKSGQRAEAIAIAEPLSYAAEIDPSLHVALAAFYLSVRRPEAAVRHLDAAGSGGRAAAQSALLRDAASRQFAERRNANKGREEN